MKYHNITPVNKQLAQEIFESKNISEICDALVSVTFHEHDFYWAQEKCLCFLQSPDAEISGLAATCLGHLARIHAKLDKEKVVHALTLRQNDPEISGRIQDALDDIEMFVLD